MAPVRPNSTKQRLYSPGGISLVLSTPVRRYSHRSTGRHALSSAVGSRANTRSMYPPSGRTHAVTIRTKTAYSPTAALSSRRRGSRPALVQREVQQQHVDNRLPEEAPLPPLDVPFDERAHIRCRGAACDGHARHLEERRRGRDVRIEARGRGGHQIDRDRFRGLILPRRAPLRVGLIDQPLRLLVQVSSARNARIVNVCPPP